MTDTKQNPPPRRQRRVTLPVMGGGGMWRWQSLRQHGAGAAGLLDICWVPGLGLPTLMS